MTEQDIKLHAYTTEWKQKFLSESKRLDNILKDYLVANIEHVGSTAVKGILAKPTIDIMVPVDSLTGSLGAIQVLQDNGYCYYPYKPHQMHWFCAPSPQQRDFHLHLVPYQSSLWQERIVFRNALIKSRILREKYSELKQSLIEQNATDRESYTQAKWPFIKNVLAKKIKKPV